MKKINAKNALRVLVAAVCTTIATMSFTACSNMNFDDLTPKTVTEYLETEKEYLNWGDPTHLYIGTSSYSSWVLSTGNLQFDKHILEIAGEKQGNPGFSTEPMLHLVNYNDEVATYAYSITGKDGQIGVDTLQVKRNADCTISNLKVHLTVTPIAFKGLGDVPATEINVAKTVEFDLTLADGREDHIVHNTSGKFYIQSERPTRVEEFHHWDSIFVYRTDSIIDTIYVDRIEYIIKTETLIDSVVVEKEIEKLVHDSIPYYVHDSIYVDRVDSFYITIIEEKEVIRWDTAYVDRYIYLAAEHINQKSRVGYATAEVKVGDENILTANLTLKERFIKVALEDLCKVDGSGNFSGCTLDDGQTGTLTYTTNGCTVDDVKWGLQTTQLSEVDCEIEVICTLNCSRSNERGEVMGFQVVMEPAYYHLSSLPEPEPQVVTYSVGFSNEAPANNKMSGTFFVDGTDGFHEEYTMPVAVYGLPQGIETLYVKDMTTYGHTAESTEPEHGTLKAKNGFNWAYDVVYTTIETQFKTVNDGLVGPYNRLTYKVAHVERTLPNGETVVWKIKATTVVDADEYVQDPACSDHFCEEEQHQAHYEKSLHQHVTHYISGSVKIGNGEEMEVIFTDLQKVGDKYLLDEGTAVTNIYSTGN